MKRMLLIILMLLVSVPAIAADRRFAWDPTPTSNVLGYTLYYAGPVSGGLTGAIPADVSSDGAVHYVLDTTGWSGDYTFYVTAYNQDGESEPSNLVTSFLGVPVGVGNFRLE